MHILKMRDLLSNYSSCLFYPRNACLAEDLLALKHATGCKESANDAMYEQMWMLTGGSSCGEARVGCEFFSTELLAPEAGICMRCCSTFGTNQAKLVSQFGTN